MLSSLLLCLGTVPVIAAGHEATAVARFDDESTGLAILRAEVSLPIPGYWFIRPGAVVADSPLAEIFLEPTGEAEVLLSGRRTAENDERDEMNRGGWPLSSLYGRIQRHTTFRFPCRELVPGVKNQRRKRSRISHRCRSPKSPEWR